MSQFGFNKMARSKMAVNSWNHRQLHEIAQTYGYTDSERAWIRAQIHERNSKAWGANDNRKGS